MQIGFIIEKVKLDGNCLAEKKTQKNYKATSIDPSTTLTV